MKLNDKVRQIHTEWSTHSWLERNRQVIAVLAEEVTDLVAYTERLHRLIEVSVDLEQQPEIKELMGEVPTIGRYEQ